MQSPTRQPALDGLRAIAVVLVLGYHGFGESVTGGWLGVDVFLVLSGFLMGLILIPQLDVGRLNLRDFWARRVRRLLPALVTVVGVTLVLAWLLLSGEAFRQFSESALWSLAFSSNIFFWQNSGYFDTPLNENPLLHLWSVSLEGQFYIVLVLILILAVRLGPKSFTALAWTTGLLSLALALSGAVDPETNFFLLPTRIWEFIAGVLLANALRRRETSPLPEWALTSLGAVGGLTIVGWGLFADSSTYSALASVAVSAGTLALIFSATFSRPVARVLSVKPLVGMGLVSYSLYLWHWPLLVLGREVFVEFEAPQVALTLLLSLALSVLSWRFIEQPFRRRSPFGVSKQSVRLAVPTALLITGLVATSTGALGASGLRFQTIDVAGYAVGQERAQEDRWELIRDSGGGIGPDCGDGDDDHQGWFDPDDERPGLVVIGNSHARDLFNVLAQSEKTTSRYQVGKMSCQLVNLLYHPGFLDSETYTLADSVILASRYSDIDVAALPEVIERIKADGKTVVIAAPFPDIDIDTREEWMWIDSLVFAEQALWKNPEALASRTNQQAFKVFAEAEAPFDAEVREVAQAYRVPVLDRLDYVCDPIVSECAVLSSTMKKHFYDESHHSLVGADHFAERVDEIGWLVPLERARLESD